MPRFAANLSLMFTEHAFLDRFAAAAAAGFTAVEYLFPYDHPPEVIADRLKAAGLTQALFNMPPGDWAAGDRGLAALPHRRDAFREAVTTAVAYGRTIGTPLLHMMAGIAPWANTDARASYVDNARYAADKAAEAGIGLVLEPINARDMPGYFLCDFDGAVRLLDEIDHPNIRLQFDIYHRQIMRGDVIRGLEQLMPRIGHVQIAAVPHRNEPGTGELDDARILATLDTLGYAGFVGCEYRPAAGTVEGLSWLRRLSAT
ncbi:2-oxo-tetronate isomerase [Chthonobacter albigriseus]|uniref:2-oxo-tetronate isomerase n=1 Tax=Chthonobacter albigriseus TaxID=1683161 RepID=UPI0015EFBB55|nr:2-oxo-tetronate isomerase [Chthonobacter albigriseus]